MTEVVIEPFRPELAETFKNLNVEWLQKYFVVEPHDEELLQKCEETIIKKGGFIFFAMVNNKAVGTFAFIKLENKIFELGKMAVSPEYQGLKIGQKLLDFAIYFAEKHHWKKIILYSNTKLENAIYLYRKYGFTEIDLEKNTPYQRSNIKMELVL